MKIGKHQCQLDRFMPEMKLLKGKNLAIRAMRRNAVIDVGNLHTVISIVLLEVPNAESVTRKDIIKLCVDLSIKNEYNRLPQRIVSF
jgi:hypothetical protein